MNLQINRVEACFKWLDKEFESTGEMQSLDVLIMKLDMLCASLPFVNNQMAIARRGLNERKVKAYETLAVSSVANQDYFAPSLAREYISSKCSQEQYNYDICERASRTIIHLCDAYRTMISALKMEREVSNYSQNVLR